MLIDHTSLYECLRGRSNLTWADLQRIHNGEPHTFTDSDGVTWVAKCHLTMNLETGEVVFHD